VTGTTFLELKPSDGAMIATLLLAHGAGAPMTSPFLERVCGLLAERGVATARFEFAYMAQRREGGKRRPPPRAERLIGEYETAVRDFTARAANGTMPLLIGGKSLGGRVATMCAERLFTEGLISGVAVLGYPFHSPGRTDEPRIAHLATIEVPVLIVQGERDPFGNRSDVAGYGLSPSIQLAWAKDGDHDLGPRGGQGVTRTQNLEMAADAIVRFASALAQLGNPKPAQSDAGQVKKK